MPIQIQGPDDVINEFPDGTSDADISTAMSQHYAKFNAPSTATATGGGGPVSAAPFAPQAPAPLGIAAGEYAGMPIPTSIADLRQEGHILKEQARQAADTATFGQEPRIVGAANYALGNGYQASADAERQKLASFQQENPNAAMAGNVVGGLAGGAAIGAGGLAARLAQAGGWAGRALGLAGEGGAYAAAQRAGHLPDNATTQDYINAVKEGGWEGAKAGAGLSLGGSVLGGAANLVRPGVGDIGRGATNILQAQGAGSPRVAQALQQYGPEASFADASPALLGGAQATARGIGPARDTMTDFFSQRAAGRDPRITQSFNQNFGQAVSPQVLTDELQKARGIASGPLYDQAFANAPPVKIQPIIDSIQQRLATAVGPEKNALNTAYNYLVEPISGGGNLVKTDAQSIHKAKVALDSLVSNGNDTLGVPRGSLNLKNNALINNSDDPTKRGILPQLSDALKAQVPGYADAAAKSAQYAQAMEHVQQGVEAAKPSTFPGQVTQTLRDATPDNTTAYREGYLGAIAPTIGNAGNELSAAKRVMGGEMGWPRQKSNAILGEEPTSNFVNTIGNEQKFGNTENRVIGNSVTAEKQAAGEAMDAMNKQWQVPWNISPTGILLGAPQRALSYALTRLAGARGDAIQNALAKSYTLSGPQRDALQQALANRGQVTGTLRNAATDPRLLAAALAGQQSGRQ